MATKKKKGTKPSPPVEQQASSSTTPNSSFPIKKSGKKKKAVPADEGAAANSGASQKAEVEVPDVVDDLLTGVATLWTVAVATGHGARKVVDTVAYPVKEGVLAAHDGVKSTVAPGAGGWAALRGQIGNPAVCTFAHEDLPSIQVDGRARKIRDRE